MGRSQCKSCTHYQDIEEGVMGQSGDLNEPHCYTGKCHLHQKKVDLFDGCGQFKSMKEDNNHSANKDEPLTPQNYQRFDIKDKFYDAVIIATDYTFSVGEFVDGGERLFIDLTLKMGQQITDISLIAVTIMTSKSFLLSKLVKKSPQSLSLSL